MGIGRQETETAFCGGCLAEVIAPRGKYNGRIQKGSHVGTQPKGAYRGQHKEEIACNQKKGRHPPEPPPHAEEEKEEKDW